MSSEYSRPRLFDADNPGGVIGSIMTNQYEKEYIEDAKNIEKMYYDKAVS
jgi:hypothetical protein